MDEEFAGKLAARLFLGLFFAVYAVIGYLNKSVHIIGLHAVVPPLTENYRLAAFSIGTLAIYLLLSAIRKLEPYLWPLLVVSILSMAVAIMA